MEEATQPNPVRSERGWRLFLLLPRLLLFRPPRGGNIHKNKLGERFQAFAEGRWSHLLSKADNVRKMLPWQCTGGATHHNRIWTDGRCALRVWFRWGSCLGRGQPRTREPSDSGCTPDPQRRPLEPRDPIPRVLLDFVPEMPFDLDETKFASNVRSARRGAAAGPSGMTVEHMRLVLDNVRDGHLLFSMAEQLSRAHVPLSVTDAPSKNPVEA